MITALAVPMTDREFGIVFAKLAIQLRWQDAGEIEIRSYFDALRHFPLAEVRTAAEGLALERGRKFFPTTGEWRDAIEAEHARQLAMASTPRIWRVECEDCEDCGWQRFECPGNATCGRQNPHDAHSFVRVCSCRPTNHTYQRHHAR